MVWIIVVLLSIIGISEGVLLCVIAREYRRQVLKVKLLTGIIEERFSDNGKDFDNRQFV